MKESELRKLFLIILHSYSRFQYDDFKVGIWMELLKDVPYEQAAQNLRRHINDPTKEFPPHPGILAESKVQRAGGPDSPNALETRRMLDERDRLLTASKEIPAFVREEVKRIAQRNAASTSRAGANADGSTRGDTETTS